VEDGLWPRVETFLDKQAAAGVAVAVVRDDEVVVRGFGVRDVETGAPVTAETMFHLASVSKPFVATAVVALATGRDNAAAALDLDAPIIDWVPEFTLADGRAAEVTARGLLSHTSGLPDVADYGWHDPQLHDDALSEFARSLSGWRLKSEPGSAFSYSNAGYELLGLLLSRVTGTTFEDAVRRQVLLPLEMRDSTFLRSEVPGHLAASPHVGMPLTVPQGVYPYTRRHAPSSTLHSNLVEMCRWLLAHLEPATGAAAGSGEQWTRLDPELVDQMRQPVVEVGEPPWDESAALGWAVGTYRGHRAFGHSGSDPGFGSRLTMVPSRRTGVIVLANSNTVPVSLITKAALDLVLADDAHGEGVSELRGLLPSIVEPLAETLRTSGPAAAAAEFYSLASAEPAAYDVDDEVFEDAVWGAIELHRTSMVWPLLRLWTQLRPQSSTAWTMTGWAHQVDGQPDQALSLLRRALDLDPENHDAALIMSTLPASSR
jgi:CubicO group peptidase (beta-lactamase class C family)